MTPIFNRIACYRILLGYSLICSAGAADDLTDLAALLPSVPFQKAVAHAAVDERYEIHLAAAFPQVDANGHTALVGHCWVEWHHMLPDGRHLSIGLGVNPDESLNVTQLFGLLNRIPFVSAWHDFIGDPNHVAFVLPLADGGVGPEDLKRLQAGRIRIAVTKSTFDSMLKRALEFAHKRRGYSLTVNDCVSFMESMSNALGLTMPLVSDKKPPSLPRKVLRKIGEYYGLQIEGDSDPGKDVDLTATQIEFAMHDSEFLSLIMGREYHRKFVEASAAMAMNMGGKGGGPAAAREFMIQKAALFQKQVVPLLNEDIALANSARLALKRLAAQQPGGPQQQYMKDFMNLIK